MICSLSLSCVLLLSLTVCVAIVGRNNQRALRHYELPFGSADLPVGMPAGTPALQLVLLAALCWVTAQKLRLTQPTHSFPAYPGQVLPSFLIMDFARFSLISLCLGTG